MEIRGRGASGALPRVGPGFLGLEVSTDGGRGGSLNKNSYKIKNTKLGRGP